MTESKVRVKTSDGNITEVDLDIAKQWGPINNMYEGIFISQLISFDSSLILSIVFGTVNTDENPVELENINTAILTKVIFDRIRDEYQLNK